MDIGSREYPARPLVGVGALIIQGSKIVLVRRSKPPSQGEWSIPGGLARVGETLTQAVIREALEETGLIVRIGPLVDVVERVIRDKNDRVQFHYVIADYKCSVISGALVAGSDASNACWAQKDHLGDFKLPAISLRVIEKAFQMGE
ncbi:MAG: NUDIX hydrolase [Deltaproteobacteria bacterium]|nr:NUDIX hydrolase [Deltaproteobacteria bacterium]